MKKFVFYLIAIFQISTIFATELSRCCSGGARHYIETQTCLALKSAGSSITCSRTASICCLRALLDNSCNAGAKLAKRHGYCSMNVNGQGGGIERECCDCCLLAKDLISKNESCIAPKGFSTVCMQSFNDCCKSNRSNDYEDDDGPISLNTNSNKGNDRCTTARCEHFCNDRGGNSVECSCRPGYDLGPDGESCIDIDECYNFPCNQETETCINTNGGYFCESKHDYSIPQPAFLIQRLKKKPYYFSGGKSQRISVISPLANALINQERFYENDIQTHLCSKGYQKLSAKNECIDVDECLLLLSDCLESQRCLNTPGSFKCIRTLSCGTGYALDSDTEECKDVDECTLGTHDCGALYQCRNTQGSYRCDPKKCAETEIMNPTTGECASIDCPTGYLPKDGRCEDVDECLTTPNRCSIYEECINSPGSYRCQEKGSFCSFGYRIDKDTGFCNDIDECAIPSLNNCGAMMCINLPGSYKCRCSAGYEFNETIMKCEDVNECKKFAGHMCSLHATCENTIGSFKCFCKPGFTIAADGRNCDDVDECSNGVARCQQKCVNTPGSYQCICDRGYQLSADELTCEDIDECSNWAKSGSQLCMGNCINTPGSFKCTCPVGYDIQPDGITCKDIDECSQGACHGSNNICVNTLGSFKCQPIYCPPNYIPDKNYKNRCIRSPTLCNSVSVEICKQYPAHISWEHIAIPKHVNISSQRTSVTLFSMKGPSNPNAAMQFELRVVKAKTGY
uniref:Fibulin-1 n=1 Tax=Panagrolaimus superbus TaxID=310955 RepID=A0A914Y378_9BILA